MVEIVDGHLDTCEILLLGRVIHAVVMEVIPMDALVHLLQVDDLIIGIPIDGLALLRILDHMLVHATLDIAKLFSTTFDFHLALSIRGTGGCICRSGIQDLVLVDADKNLPHILMLVIFQIKPVRNGARLRMGALELEIGSPYALVTHQVVARIDADF